jgi:ribonuclease-3
LHTLETTIGYTFNDPALLAQAMSHSSYANEHGTGSNERLEFLGDSVLGFLTAEHLFSTYPGLSEGDLTRRRAQMVCERSLLRVADGIKLRGFVLLGKGEGQAGARDSILADGVEALIGALFLDGGAEVVKRFAESFLWPNFNSEASFSAMSDAKTALQEVVQRERGAELTYRLLREEGPDHAKTFYVEVLRSGQVLAEGSGRSKKEAEQDAAGKALAVMPWS